MNPKALTTAGTLALAISIVWPRIVRGTTLLTGDTVDLVQGLFLGVALGLLFLAVRLGRFGPRRNS